VKGLFGVKTRVRKWLPGCPQGSKPDLAEGRRRVSAKGQLGSFANDGPSTINRLFEAEGLPTFYTRFGIHVGEAVVGNLGSSERMNYTALGNVVNLAARLEGLNKQYGTQILVSEAVHERVKHNFCCRFVDAVVAKGMAAETSVYELLNETAKESNLSR
jgi:class 3 adenylate cyclase